jgi:hypothetical protein
MYSDKIAVPPGGGGIVYKKHFLIPFPARDFLDLPVGSCWTLQLAVTNTEIPFQQLQQT